MDGEQLDRVGLRRGGDVEPVAELVLGGEVGEQGRQCRRPVDGLELRDRLDEQVEVVAARAGRRAHRGVELDVDAAGVDDPAHQVEQRLAGVRAQVAELARQRA